VKNPWDRKELVAGGFWVDDFIGIGSRKELEALKNGVDVKYGVTVLRGGQMGPRYADCSARTISISQGAFIDLILTRFNLTDAAPVTTPLVPGTHLSTDDCPTSKDEMEMTMRPYSEPVGDVAWLALGTRPSIAFAASSFALRPQPWPQPRTCSLGSSEVGTGLPQGHEGVVSNSRRKDDRRSLPSPALTGKRYVIRIGGGLEIEGTIMHRGFIDRGVVYSAFPSVEGVGVVWWNFGEVQRSMVVNADNQGRARSSMIVQSISTYNTTMRVIWSRREEYHSSMHRRRTCWLTSSQSLPRTLV
jgi:hypothetical protein